MEAWEKRLGLLSETLDEWVAVQRNWMYLETIFCAEDIQKQLPEEAAKFQTVDKMWKVGHHDTPAQHRLPLGGSGDAETLSVSDVTYGLVANHERNERQLIIWLSNL